MAVKRIFITTFLTLMYVLSFATHATEEVVVTARKTAEKLQEVPISVSVIDNDQLQNMAINDLQDLSVYVPGLQQQVLPLASRLILRGVTSGDNNAFEQAIGIYVDGIYRGRMNQQHAGYLI